MKFKIRYADQIVGIFSLAAIAALIIFIFAIGAAQNWFVKKNNYYTIFDSGSGFSAGMDLTYKGFSIGKVKSITLKNGMVRVDYYVLDDYASYVHENSLVELITSPIGLGSSFVLHPGNNKNLLASDSEIYRLDSGYGRELIEKNLVHIESQSDSIGVLMNKVSAIMDNVNRLLSVLNDALRGNGDTPIKQIVGNVDAVTKNLIDLSGNISGVAKNLSEFSSSEKGLVPGLLGDELSGNINGLMENLSVVTKDLQGISGSVSGLVGEITPEIDAALINLNSSLVQVNDVLTGVKNNPLIRGGVPDRSQGDSSTAQLRDVDF